PQRFLLSSAIAAGLLFSNLHPRQMSLDGTGGKAATARRSLKSSWNVITRPPVRAAPRFLFVRQWVLCARTLPQVFELPRLLDNSRAHQPSLAKRAKGRRADLEGAGSAGALIGSGLFLLAVEPLEEAALLCGFLVFVALLVNDRLLDAVARLHLLDDLCAAILGLFF